MRQCRSCLVACLILALTLPLAACGSENPSEQDRTIRLVEVTHSLFYAPQYIAMSKKFFEEEGLKIQLRNGFGGDKTMTTLLSGESDVILMGQEGAVYVTARGATDPVMAFAQLTQTDGSFLIARNPHKDFSWEDLEGQIMLGQRKGGMPGMVSNHVLRKHGVEPQKDVKVLKNVDYKNLGSANASGSGNYAQLFEPLASQLEKEGKGYVVASFGKDSGKLPYTVYIAKQSWLKENPDTVKKFIRALYKAQQWAQSHSIEEIADVVQPYFSETDRTIIERVLQRYKSQESWATDPIIDRKEYNHMIEIMRQAGELPGEVPYDTVTEMTPAKSVIQE